MAETALIHEVYIRGIWKRAVDDLVKALSTTGIFKSQVSRLCAELDERVTALFDRRPRGITIL